MRRLFSLAAYLFHQVFVTRFVYCDSPRGGSRHEWQTMERYGGRRACVRCGMVSDDGGSTPGRFDNVRDIPTSPGRPPQGGSAGASSAPQHLYIFDDSTGGTQQMWIAFGTNPVDAARRLIEFIGDGNHDVNRFSVSYSGLHPGVIAAHGLNACVNLSGFWPHFTSHPGRHSPVYGCRCCREKRDAETAARSTRGADAKPQNPPESQPA